MSEFWEMLFWAREKARAGWFHSKTEVLNTSQNIPTPGGTKSYPKITISIL